MRHNSSYYYVFLRHPASPLPDSQKGFFHSSYRDATPNEMGRVLLVDLGVMGHPLVAVTLVLPTASGEGDR
jgi:hypothetical protein